MLLCDLTAYFAVIIDVPSAAAISFNLSYEGSRFKRKGKRMTSTLMKVVVGGGQKSLAQIRQKQLARSTNTTNKQTNGNNQTHTHTHKS